MKKFIGFILLFAAVTLNFVSCKSTDEPVAPKLPSTPEAKATYDSNSGGIIKGIMVGSSGIFKFSLKNGNDSIYCKVTFDGATGMLYTTDLNSWNPGNAINNAKFTGRIGTTDIAVYLWCAGSGGNIVVSFQITGHNIVTTVLKETSTVLVKGYEGTYKSTKLSDNSTVDEGIFNFLVAGNYMYGQRRSITHSTDYGIKGTISGSTLTVDGKIMTIDDQTVSATITNDGEKLVVSGKRTM